MTRYDRIGKILLIPWASSTARRSVKNVSKYLSSAGNKGKTEFVESLFLHTKSFLCVFFHKPWTCPFPGSSYWGDCMQEHTGSMIITILKKKKSHGTVTLLSEASSLFYASTTRVQAFREIYQLSDGSTLILFNLLVWFAAETSVENKYSTPSLPISIPQKHLLHLV